MPKQKGFTLIELLVVISIIALLLSILMPSLQKVKKQAQAVVDRSNIKQLYVALTMYVEDNDNKIWRGFWWDATDCHPWDPPRVEHNWWMPAIMTYAGEVGKIRFCPAATKRRYNKDGSNGVGWKREPFTAWGYNDWLDTNAKGVKNCDFGSYAVNGWIEDNWNDCKPGKEKFWRRSNKISQAERVPFLVDGQWIDVWPEPSGTQGLPPQYEDIFWDQGQDSRATGSPYDRVVQNRHNGQVNVVFMDGSSRLVGLKELWTLKWHRTYNTRGMYTLAQNADSSTWPVWMRSFKQY